MTAEELVEKVARMFSTDFGEDPDADDVMVDVRTMEPVSNWTLYAPIARAAIAIVIEECAKVIADHNRDGRNWVNGSLWDSITREDVARLRTLSPSTDSRDGELGR